MQDTVIIRKPTDNEQIEGKIVTSDYAISCVTIHSSVLHTLDLIDKVYRSKQTTISPSNVKEIERVKKSFINILKGLPSNFTPSDIWDYCNYCNENREIISYIIDNKPKSWGKIKDFKYKHFFKTPSAAIKAEKQAFTFTAIFRSELLEGMSDDMMSNTITIKDFLSNASDYLDKIKHNSIKKHTQTHIWEKAYKSQLNLEKVLGKKFSPSDYAIYLSNNKPFVLYNIINEWNINIADFDTWDDLCNYLYSPNMINMIRKKINVNVRARSSCDVRKGVESNQKKKYQAAILNYEKILGCSVDRFNLDDETNKINSLNTEIAKYKVMYSEAQLALNHAKSSKSPDYKALLDATNSIKNKLNYTKSLKKELEKSLPKKKSAYEKIKNYIQKNKELENFIISSRPWEEVAKMEEDSLLCSLKRQKEESPIPYYTWRFVCDKIDKDTALKIEDALEENLNKGSGVNGEDGYINVTAFPMSKSYEFFVDYPKSSNMFKAFKKKGKELSKILIEGVANHLGIKFVCCDGETFVNNPMEKTMNGDMLEWVGV